MTPGQLRVNIFGSDYTLISDKEEEYVKEIARYLDKKMRDMDKNPSLKSSNRLAVLTALNIAEELFQEREYRKKVIDQLNEEIRKVNNSITCSHINYIYSLNIGLT